MTSMTLVRRIAARPSIVFEALSTPEGITSWWGPDDTPVEATADVRVGGQFQARFFNLDGYEHVCAGQFLEIVRPRRIVMSWQWISGGAEPEEHDSVSRVELHLRPIETGTELTLIHADLRNEVSAASHERGWNGALDKLVRNFVTN